MRSLVLVFGTAMVISTAAAIAGDETPSTTQAAPAAQPAVATIPDGDKMECRNLSAKTGSRLGARRECRTKREWDDIRHQNERELEKMQTRDPMVPH
jgi:hypothetical protein